MNAHPTQEYLKEHFDYNDGQLLRKKSAGRMVAGDPLGYKTDNGYIRCQLKGKGYLVHRLIWIWHNGDIGELLIDHRDTVRDNNYIDNLRLATEQQNSLNRRDTKGYHWDKARSKWRCRIKVSGKFIHLGYFDVDDEDEAGKCHADAKEIVEQYLNSETTIDLSILTMAVRKRNKHWMISVGGYGAFLFEGNEKEAEEMRRHKARWEQACARLRRATPQEIKESMVEHKVHPMFKEV